MIWPTIVAAVALALFYFTASLDEWHHFYIGAAVYLTGAIALSPPIMWVGALIMIDDGLQHALKRQSPLHWLYQRTIAHVALVRRVNEWLDRMMRR